MIDDKNLKDAGTEDKDTEPTTTFPKESSRTPSAGIMHDEVIKKNLESLMKIIDKMAVNYKHASELVLEIAKRLDEHKQFSHHQIGYLIKQFFRAKILEEKIAPTSNEKDLFPKPIDITCINCGYTTDDESDMYLHQVERHGNDAQ